MDSDAFDRAHSYEFYQLLILALTNLEELFSISFLHALQGYVL